MLKYVGPSSLVVSAVIATLARPALAIELRWQAPAECPNSAVIAKDVARLAGAQEGRDLIAQVVIARGPDNRWRVVIELSGSAAGHRELTADSCSQLSRAAALIIALAANPEAALDLPTEETLPTTGSPATPTVGVPPTEATSRSLVATPTTAPVISPEQARGASSPDSPAAAGEAERPLQLWALASLGYDQQSLPVSTEFLRLGLRLRHRRLGGVFTADITRSGRAEFTDGFGAKFRSAGAQLLGCVEPLPVPLHAAVCIGPRLEALFADGYGTSKDFNAWVSRPSGVFAAQFAYDVSSRFSLGLTGEMLAFARRPQFVVENVDALLYQPATLGFRVAIEIAVRP